jgi:hypothetical protein
MAASAAWARLNEDSVNANTSIPVSYKVISDANKHHIARICNSYGGKRSRKNHEQSPRIGHQLSCQHC